MTDLLMTHQEFEQRNPDELETEQMYEQHRRLTHIKAGGSPESYVQRREFPCRGDLRIVDREGAMWSVRCSACQFETTVRPMVERPAVSAGVRPQDGWQADTEEVEF